MVDRPEPQSPGSDKIDDIGVLRAGERAGEVLGLCDEFFRSHASPAVLAELRRFLTELGHHPVAGMGAFLTKLSVMTLHVDTGRPRPHELERARELTRSLARASLLPTGTCTRDVGIYRALEVMVRSPGEYWATADIIDDEGAGHLEVTVGIASQWSPPTLADLQHPDYPGVTGAERHEPDGSVVTVCTTRSPDPDSVISCRAILARPDGTYVDVRTTNQDARTGGRRTRPTPPVDAEIVLDKLGDMRP